MTAVENRAALSQIADASLLCWSYCSYCPVGLGEVPGVADGFASVPGVGEGRIAGFFSGLDAGETPGDGLPSVVGDFFAVAVVCVGGW